MTELGALTLPALPPEYGEAVTDPVLTYLPGFIEAALTRELENAWAAVSADPVVRKSFAHDPEVCDVSDKDFPALFVWRGSTGPVERTSEDKAEFRPRINVLWVFAAEKQLKLVRQLPIFNGIEKALFKALDEGRTPGWKVQGDPDLSTPKRGSLVWKYTGADFKALLSANPDSGVTVEMITGGKLESYPALLFTLDLLEQYLRTPSLDDYAPHRATVDVTKPNPDADEVRLRAFDQPPTPP